MLWCMLTEANGGLAVDVQCNLSVGASVSAMDWV